MLRETLVEFEVFPDAPGIVWYGDDMQLHLEPDATSPATVSLDVIVLESGDSTPLDFENCTAHVVHYEDSDDWVRYSQNDPLVYIALDYTAISRYAEELPRTLTVLFQPTASPSL